MKKDKSSRFPFSYGSEKNPEKWIKDRFYK